MISRVKRVSYEYLTERSPSLVTAGMRGSATRMSAMSPTPTLIRALMLGASPARARAWALHTDQPAPLRPVEQRGRHERAGGQPDELDLPPDVAKRPLTVMARRRAG